MLSAKQHILKHSASGGCAQLALSMVRCMLHPAGATLQSSPTRPGPPAVPQRPPHAPPGSSLCCSASRGSKTFSSSGSGSSQRRLRRGKQAGTEADAGPAGPIPHDPPPASHADTGADDTTTSTTTNASNTSHASTSSNATPTSSKRSSRRSAPQDGPADGADSTSPSAAAADDTGDGPSTSSAPHLPVLLHEVLAAFQPVQLHTYLDGTLGAGGHASALAAAHPEMRLLLGIDLDPTAHALAGPRVAAAVQQREGFQLVQLRGNYSDMRRLLAGVSSPAPRPNGILMDLGVSSMQLDTADRGFSFMRDGPLDMRMDPQAGRSAEELVNTASEAELGRILRDYGEEKLWKVVARRIVQAREVAPILTTQQLVQAVGYTQLGGGKGKGRGKGVHPATRTFQAVRIAVNDELVKLERALPDAVEALAPGGRLAVISFHSLEDRLVKHAFLRAAGRPTPEEEHLTYGPGKFDYLDRLEASRVAEQVGRKPQGPTDEEAEANPRARSAKLRVLQKL